MSPQHSFETLEHRMPDGSVEQIPYYFDESKQMNTDSGALVQIADIIGPRLKIENDPEVLSRLVDQVGTIISNPDDKQGIVIEDTEGIDSFTVTPESTTVFVRESGKHTMSSTLVFDMLYSWNEHRTQGN